jgi:hypothetical protein
MELKTFERLMSAVTFSEAGEWETAKELYPGAKRPLGILERIRSYFVAQAFAEEGLQDEALRILGTQRKRETEVTLEGFLEDVGLRNVQFHFVVVRS